MDIGQRFRKKIMTTEKKTTRSPVVVILGHVDHGKTTLLDFIRKSNVAQKETGGITQHIGAYQIEHAGRLVTCLDTPGHEAFSEMRRRGARVADIAVLVVAADESIKPQTLEAAACITETEIPFVVALNKIDKPGADINRVKKDLSEHNILIEEWGVNVPALEISAKTGKGVPELLDMLLLMWDMKEETEEAENTDAEGMGGPRSVGKGVVIESRLDSRRGAIATVLVTFGEFKKNDAVLCGASVGKIKLLEDFKGEEIDVARAATPVRIMGLETVPVLGDTCVVAGNLEEARAAGALSQQKIDEERKEVLARIAAAAQSAKKILAIILRADVKGSEEAIIEALEKIAHAEVGLRIIESGVGDITEADIKSAESSKAVVFGFRAAFPAAVEQYARQRNVRGL